MLIRSMGPISEKDTKYSMDCYLRQEWQDDRLKFQGPLEQLTLNINMLEYLWKPDTYFHNGRGSYVHTITRPNKLFRIYQTGKILYSMRLTIEATCPMELRNFPMDKQSCPLVISSYAYAVHDVIYEWDHKMVSFVPGMALSQYDLLNMEFKNYSAKLGRGDFYSVLQVNFNLQRHTGYFLIQVYIPCILIVILSWVSFWINREATSDRVGLGITTVLTLSTISLDTRTDLPKVHYATALDWFILMSFGYCIATLLEFASVHFFTKIGSGEFQVDDEDEWLDLEVTETDEDVATKRVVGSTGSEYFPDFQHPPTASSSLWRRADETESFLRSPCFHLHQQASFTSFHSKESMRNKLERGMTIQESCCHSDEPLHYPSLTRPSQSSFRTTETQTEKHDYFCSQFLKCVAGNDKYRRERRRQALKEGSTNSVSVIDRISRVTFPASYGFLNLWYWYSYYHTQIQHSWKEPGLDPDEAK